MILRDPPRPPEEQVRAGCFRQVAVGLDFIVFVDVWPNWVVWLWGGVILPAGIKCGFVCLEIRDNPRPPEAQV